MFELKEKYPRSVENLKSLAYLEESEEVLKAKKEKKPILALESAIITHGMPYPDNFELALKLEEIAKSSGVIPATIGLINGKIKVGLSKDEIEFLSRAKWIKKIGPKDIPLAVSSKYSGGTTVAASLLICDATSIKVFVTGGIGGVHRGYDKVLDISQDIFVISSSKAITVSCGVKSILDVSNTLELLESLSVLVIGYKTKYFPLFYVKESEHLLEYNFENIDDIVNLLKVNESLGYPLRRGALVVTPIPDEFKIEKEEHNSILEKALKKIDEENIRGKNITPFILSYMQKNLKGTIEANKALIQNNVKVGSLIALKLY